MLPTNENPRHSDKSLKCNDIGDIFSIHKDNTLLNKRSCKLETKTTMKIEAHSKIDIKSEQEIIDKPLDHTSL